MHNQLKARQTEELREQKYISAENLSKKNGDDRQHPSTYARSITRRVVSLAARSSASALIKSN